MEKCEEKSVIHIKLRDVHLPEQHGDWIDLCTAEEAVLGAGEFKLISLGVAMKLPKGYYVMVVPRSSTFMKWGVLQANSVGIIDNGYCGDNDIWKFPAYAVRDTVIPKGTRVCQFKLFKRGDGVIFNTVDRLTDENRGGFGSSGD